MRYGNYLFSGTLTQDAHLPVYKGSTFRGAFGVALKRTVCALRKQDCSTCLLRITCLYARVFERKAATEKTSRLAALPHPYVIQPPMSEVQQLAAGSQFAFNLLLFGEYNDALPYFIYAFEKMGQLGIGKGKAQFVLDHVESGEQTLYRRDSTELESVRSEKRLALPLDTTGSAADLRLQLLTPLRVKQKGHFVRHLDFATLFRIALRRLSSLLATYGEGDPQLPYRELLNQAEKVEIERNSSHWHDWQRYSNRQHESMQFGGLVGEIDYRQVPFFHRQLLAAVSQVHLGKQTSFGLGRIAVENL